MNDVATSSSAEVAGDAGTKAEERRTFFFLSVLLAPLLSVVLVGGYGFLIWMSQILLGPPTS